MVSHSSHTSHEILTLVIRVTNVSFERKFCHLRKRVDNDLTFEENFPSFKILVSFIFFNMANLLKIKL